MTFKKAYLFYERNKIIQVKLYICKNLNGIRKKKSKK